MNKMLIACIVFLVAYIIALLYRIFKSKELYYFPFALSILSLIAMFICLYFDNDAFYILGISAVLNLFSEK